MSRTHRPRDQLLDLLRPPISNDVDTWSTGSTVDPEAQLREVTELVEQGLISVSEFDRQRRKISDL